MSSGGPILENIRAALAPHGLHVRGVLSPDPGAVIASDGSNVMTLILIGNVGSSMWEAFSRWKGSHPELSHPLDAWSEEIIRPLALSLGGQAFFPSEKPWRPFQQWAMEAEGLRPSPLGILIHPVYGLWHGYRGAIAFPEVLDHVPQQCGFDHACDRCTDKPCLSSCPVGAISTDGFGYAACRTHLSRVEGQAGCMRSGCLARNACPVGADYRYVSEHLRFHMNALDPVPPSSP